MLLTPGHGVVLPPRFLHPGRSAQVHELPLHRPDGGQSEPHRGTGLLRPRGGLHHPRRSGLTAHSHASWFFALSPASVVWFSRGSLENFGVEQVSTSNIWLRSSSLMLVFLFYLVGQKLLLFLLYWLLLLFLLHLFHLELLLLLLLLLILLLLLYLFLPSLYLLLLFPSSPLPPPPSPLSTPSSDGHLRVFFCSFFPSCPEPSSFSSTSFFSSSSY